MYYEKMKKKSEPADVENRVAIGKRFKQFRKAINKKQKELAIELKVFQSTITNIERGKNYPNHNYLVYLKQHYKLNVDWLLLGDGDFFMSEGLTFFNVEFVKDHGANLERYIELINFMKVPVVEQVIFAKLEESKVLFKEEVKQFLEQEKFVAQNPDPDEDLN
jgi:transcriptional regulator with XRE-family HTH domain